MARRSRLGWGAERGWMPAPSALAVAQDARVGAVAFLDGVVHALTLEANEADDETFRVLTCLLADILDARDRLA